MKISASLLAVGSIVLLSAAELVPFSPLHTGLVGDAHAVIGAPMTPVSVAGVARRSAVRTTAVVATSAAASSAAASSAAAAQAAAVPPPPAPGAPLAVGTVLGKLPTGCVSAPISGVEYYLCNGTYFRAVFQGNTLVYVVTKP